jgi:hypothetical protein
MFRKLYVLELIRCVQLRFVTLRHVTFTLCCLTLCSNIQIPANVDDNHAGCGCQQHPGQADGQAGQQSSLFRPEHRLEKHRAVELQLSTTLYFFYQCQKVL